MSGSRTGDRYSDATLKCLPFYVGAVNRAADAFLVEQAGPSEQNVKPDAVPFKEGRNCALLWLGEGRMARGGADVYGLFAVRIDSRPERDSEQRMREGLLPAVVARLVLDNTKGTATKTAMFALNHARPGSGFWQRIWERAAGICLSPRGGRSGGAVRLDIWEKGGGGCRSRSFSCAGQPATGFASAIIRFICWDRARDSDSKFRRERSMGLTIALGSYLEGLQTNGLDGRYLYTRYFKGLGDVLKTALDGADEMAARAEALDAKLDAAKCLTISDS